MDEQNYILEAEKKVLDIIGLPESIPRPLSSNYNLAKELRSDLRELVGLGKSLRRKQQLATALFGCL